MCKLAGWNSGDLLPLQERFADAALKAAAKEIRVTERDGFGFAQHGARGLRDRFFNPTDFQELAMLPNFKSRYGAAAKVFSVDRTTEHVGAYKPSSSMIIHGRTATTEKNLENVHPFRKNGWTLAHNGVVSYHGEDTPEHSAVTCDSQHLLLCFTKHNGDRELVKADLQNISGYAAFMCLAPDGTLIVARDATASLYAGVTSRGRWIFGTTAAIVSAIANSWDCKGVTPLLMDSWTWLEFAPGSDDPIVDSWDHAAYTASQAAYASKSLGREITAYPNTGAGDYKSTAPGYAAGTTQHTKPKEDTSVVVESIVETRIEQITLSDLYCLSPDEMIEKRYFRVYPEDKADMVETVKARLKALTSKDSQSWYTSESFAKFTPEDVYNAEEESLYGGTGLVEIVEAYTATDEDELVDSLESFEDLSDVDFNKVLEVYKEAKRGKPNIFAGGSHSVDDTRAFHKKVIETLPDELRFFRTEESVWSNAFDGNRFVISPSTNGWVQVAKWGDAGELGVGPRVYATSVPLTATQLETCRKAALSWAKNHARRVKTPA